MDKLELRPYQQQTLYTAPKMAPRITIVCAPKRVGKCSSVAGILSRFVMAPFNRD